jgi:hypothetical protein
MLQGMVTGVHSFGNLIKGSMYESIQKVQDLTKWAEDMTGVEILGDQAPVDVIKNWAKKGMGDQPSALADLYRAKAVVDQLREYALYPSLVEGSAERHMLKHDRVKANFLHKGSFQESAQLFDRVADETAYLYGLIANPASPQAKVWEMAGSIGQAGRGFVGTALHKSLSNTKGFPYVDYGAKSAKELLTKGQPIRAITGYLAKQKKFQTAMGDAFAKKWPGMATILDTAGRSAAFYGSEFLFSGHAPSQEFGDDLQARHDAAKWSWMMGPILGIAGKLGDSLDSAVVKWLGNGKWSNQIAKRMNSFVQGTSMTALDTRATAEIARAMINGEGVDGLGEMIVRALANGTMFSAMTPIHPRGSMRQSLFGKRMVTPNERIKNAWSEVLMESGAEATNHKNGDVSFSFGTKRGSVRVTEKGDV